MTARPIFAVLLGGLLGAAAVTLNPLHSAPAPEPRPQRWEYKVVFFRIEHSSQTADKLAAQMNDLAKDGWEYAGPVSSSTFQAGQVNGGYGAFRRAAPLPPPPPPQP
jgi:hypothetical protein